MRVASPADVHLGLATLDRLMPIIGEMAVSYSQAAFEEQEWDGVRWPERYPGMKDPVINIAGALGDLNKGSTIHSHRFSRRPVLRDTGLLFDSIRPQRLARNSVEIGVAGPAQNYANTQQQGGESTIPVTSAAKKGLTKFLKRRPEFTDKVGYLLGAGVTEYKVKAVGRQFIGVTESLEKDIALLVERWLSGDRR